MEGICRVRKMIVVLFPHALTLSHGEDQREPETICALNLSIANRISYFHSRPVTRKINTDTAMAARAPISRQGIRGAFCPDHFLE